MYPFSKIEKKWREKWRETGIYEPDLDKAKKPFYNLMMFPYPSGEGLHVGNMYAFTGSDIYGRYQRMRGRNVFEPIGLDGFGIHSENYAIKTGKHPMDHARTSEKNFYRQLDSIGNGFSWNEKLETYNPDYYKWTQWVFIKMWEQGLVERKKANLNWCPSCKTVLADEQVINGKCERCGSDVTKKELEQWFFKITDYAEKLLTNLDGLDWTEHIKTSQKNWIGKSEGALLRFPVRTVGNVENERLQQAKRSNNSNFIEVFTTRPDTIFGATYMVLAPENELVEKLKDRITNLEEVESYTKKTKSKTENERIAEIKSKTGVELKGITAINPATKKQIPIWIADYVLSSYGTGAIMAVPAHDQRDLEFAKKNGLEVQPVVIPTRVGPGVMAWMSENNTHNEKNILEVIEKSLENKESAYTHRGSLINSGKFSGMTSDKAIGPITKFIGGKKEVHYHLRDWLVSRQRYWGPPIPMIYCKKCALNDPLGPRWQPVPEKDLPVLLPRIDDFRPKGSSEAPLASHKEFYETTCPKCKGPARRETDVSDTFLDSAWYFFRYPDIDKNDVAFDKKRIKKWLPVPMYIGGAEHAVLHLLYSRFLTMAFKDMDLIDFEEPYTTFRAHGLLIKEGTKMSKSKGNIVNPDEYIEKFGADAVRMYLMFLGPFSEGGDWRDSGIMGVVRFLHRVWGFCERELTGDSISSLMHASTKKITNDITELKYNTAIAELMNILNRFERDGATKKDFETFLLLLAPLAPFITEELWEKLGNKYSVHTQTWPKYDEKKLVESTIKFVIQVNGKLRATIVVKKGIAQKEVEKLALAEESVRRHVTDKPEKVVFVKDRLINFVI